MEKINVNVSWCEGNFCASLGDNIPGAVVFTAATYDDLLTETSSSLSFHVNGMLSDGDNVPQWLVDGDYEFDFILDAAALIHSCEPYVSIAAISRASGINQRQLSHYANCTKKARPEQRQRIINGIHRIGSRMMQI